MKTHREIVPNGRCIASLCSALIASSLLLLPGKSMAGNYTLSDGGSTATLNLGDGSGGTGSLGMNSWTVLNGQNQLNQQWFWISINGSAPQSIDTLGGMGTSSTGPNDLTVTYQNAQVSVNVEYDLYGNGVGSGSADMMESIWIDNLSAVNSLTLSFYQYSNFDLLENNNNTVSIFGSPGAYSTAVQTTGGPGGTGFGEVILGPYANYAEAAVVPQTLNELGTPAYLTLNDNTSEGPGNVSWAFQWNSTIDPNGELDILKDKGLKVTMIPEPATLALIALGVGALGLSLRRKSA